MTSTAVGHQDAGLPTERQSLLSYPDIVESMKQGEILYAGGSPQNIRSVSIDVTLGPWYWEETSRKGDSLIFNPYSRDDVNRVWGRLCYAHRLWWWLRELNYPFTPKGVDPDVRVIFIPPGRQLLCHTQEFIGGLSKGITTMMKARSGAGRSFLEVCRCAGWGDIGYHSRWTCEVVNSSGKYDVILVVGYRYPQMVFFRTRETEETYAKDGTYQIGQTPEEIHQHWSPMSMRPAMYKDREVPASDEQRLYYRCPNPGCGYHGAKRAREIPRVCRCGTALHVYGHPPLSEKVFPLVDVCVECCHVYTRCHPKSLAECRTIRTQEEGTPDTPRRCVKCPKGFRHILGGEHDLWLPEIPDALGDKPVHPIV